MVLIFILTKVINHIIILLITTADYVLVKNGLSQVNFIIKVVEEMKFEHMI